MNNKSQTSKTQQGASQASHPLTLTLSLGERGPFCSLSFQERAGVR